jgi:peptide methionine sulfoxide reductase MsrB
MTVIFRIVAIVALAMVCSNANLIPRTPRFNVARGVISGMGVVGLGYLGGLVPNPFALAGEFPIKGDEKLMAPKEHGTSAMAVQSKLRWGCDVALADRICNYNRRWAENAGYFQSTKFFAEVDQSGKETTFYDSVTGKPLFVAPRGRSFEEFKQESMYHGWPSFRDSEVVWENVRCMGDGETVSLTGTHLGHNLPDRNGNRYCINLVSIAGYPTST